LKSNPNFTEILSLIEATKYLDLKPRELKPHRIMLRIALKRYADSLARLAGERIRQVPMVWAANDCAIIRICEINVSL